MLCGLSVCSQAAQLEDIHPILYVKHDLGKGEYVYVPQMTASFKVNSPRFLAQKYLITDLTTDIDPAILSDTVETMIQIEGILQTLKTNKEARQWRLLHDLLRNEHNVSHEVLNFREDGCLNGRYFLQCCNEHFDLFLKSLNNYGGPDGSVYKVPELYYTADGWVLDPGV